MKRLFALLLATVMVVGLTACGSKTTPDADSQPGTEVSDDNPLGLAEKIPKIGPSSIKPIVRLLIL